MSERVFSKRGLGYVMELPDLQTSLSVDRIRRSGGELHGDLTIRTIWPGARTYDGVLFTGWFNLSSATTRVSLGKYVSTRAPHPAGEEGPDWPGFIEEFCQRVVSAEREGDPIVLIGRKPSRIDPLPLVDPLLPRLKPTIVYGDGGVGKTVFAVGIGLSVKTGLEIIPGFKPSVMGQVLYLDWETDEDDIDSRLKRIAAGAGLTDEPEFLYRFCTRPLSHFAEDLAMQVANEDIALVIVDSIGAAMGGQAEGADPADAAIRLFAGLRFLRTTVLCIDHVAKAQMGAPAATSKPYGSTYKVNLARCTWEMRQAQASRNGPLHVALYHQKANTTARHQPIGLGLYFEPGLTYWKEEPIREEELLAPLTMANRIEILLRETDVMSTTEIAEALDASESTIRKTLDRHERQFESVSRGYWRLAGA
jgi:DNA-binding CsgD family transcriptional regulator